MALSDAARRFAAAEPVTNAGQADMQAYGERYHDNVQDAGREIGASASDIPYDGVAAFQSPIPPPLPRAPLAAAVTALPALPSAGTPIDAVAVTMGVARTIGTACDDVALTAEQLQVQMLIALGATPVTAEGAKGSARAAANLSAHASSATAALVDA